MKRRHSTDTPGTLIAYNFPCHEQTLQRLQRSVLSSLTPSLPRTDLSEASTFNLPVAVVVVVAAVHGAAGTAAPRPQHTHSPVGH